MIISDKYKFVFVHVPKCAGSYVRNAIIDFDDTDGLFTNRVDRHDQLGWIDYVHIPLFVLEKYFLLEYRKVCEYNSVAIIRNPEERFFSSVVQYLRNKGEKNFYQMDKVERFKCIKCVVDWLRLNKHNRIFPPEYVHFMPQYLYVENNGKKIIDNLFTVEQVEKVFEMLSDIVGYQVVSVKDGFGNASLLYKNKCYMGACESLRPLYNLMKNRLSKKIICGIKRTVFRRKIESDYESNEWEWLRGFVLDYYEKDVLLWDDLK